MSRGVEAGAWPGGWIKLPEPLGVLRPTRTERQRWHRLGRAEGELRVGYDAADRPVRVEYHWIRWLSRAHPGAIDVYTAELWARRPGGDWLYLLRPEGTSFVPVPHDRVRALLARHLNVDVGA